MALNDTRISNPTLLVNNIPIAIVANSLSYSEGLGEQTVDPQGAGGNSIAVVYGEDITTRMSMVKFSLANTVQNINQARAWKLNGNANSIVITSTGFTRTFTKMVLTANYDVGLGFDTNIELEFHGSPAI